MDPDGNLIEFYSMRDGGIESEPDVVDSRPASVIASDSRKETAVSNDSKKPRRSRK